MALTYFSVLSLFIAAALGDPNDWVSPEYVVSQGQTNGRPVTGGSDTSGARAAILRGAARTAQSGPWSVVSMQKTQPPSGDIHDYLSWAPYHWPNCNWCPSGKTHLVHTISGSDNDTATVTDGSSTLATTSTSSFNGEDPYRYFVSGPQDSGFDLGRRQASTFTPPADSPNLSPPPTPLNSSPAFAQPTRDPNPSAINSRTHVPQAAAKTAKATSTCSPSPTKSLAPSATWTSCPYVIRDGQVNPDVRSLLGPDSLNSMSQACIYNAISYTITQDISYCRKVVQFIKTFFIDEATKMNPNVNFGQVVRGLGEAGSQGTFTGILDNRGFLKVVNAIVVLRAARCPDWTSEIDEGMKSWTKKYSAWLATSEIGQKTASRPNNHCPFYKSQLAAALYLAGDTEGAKHAIDDFFKNTYPDQIAVTGEQPFEAVRTRPYHYRLFNLEALISLAKLGDYIGLDCWTKKSKYRATLQTAFDYVMKLDPKGEDKSQIYPLVPAMIAAYGDPQGKYEAFLKKNDPTYQSKSSWFYNQRGALSQAPSSRSNSVRAIYWQREDTPSPQMPGDTSIPAFTCPAIFQISERAELDNGVSVDCDDLRDFYGWNPPTSVD